MWLRSRLSICLLVSLALACNGERAPRTTSDSAVTAERFTPSTRALTSITDSIVCRACIIVSITPDSIIAAIDTTWRQTPDTIFRDSVVPVAPPPPPIDTTSPLPPIPIGHVPAGFLEQGSRDFIARSENGWTYRNDAAFTIETDPTAPSGPTAGQAYYRVGYPLGSGPVKTDLVVGRKRSLYLGYWIKFSPNFQGYYVNKIFHIWEATAASPNSGTSVAVPAAYGKGSGGLLYQVRLQNLKGTPISINLSPNRGTTAQRYFVRDRWQFAEVILDAGTGAGDGTVRWYLDGVLIGDHAGIRFNGLPWTIISWNPTIGGSPGTVTEAQWMRVDKFSVYSH